MGDDININGVTKSIVSGISEKVSDELEDQILGRLRKKLLKDLSAAVSEGIKTEVGKLQDRMDSLNDGIQKQIDSNKGAQPLDTKRFEAMILEEFLRLHKVQKAHEDEHEELLNKNNSEERLKEIEAKLDGIEGMSRSTVDSLAGGIQKQIDSNKGAQSLDTNKFEAMILEEFLRLHEVHQARENEHKALLNENISLLKQIKAACENAWKDKIEAEKKTEEIQRLWERHKNTVIPM